MTDEVEDPWEIELDEIEREMSDPFDKEQYRVTFRVSRADEGFTVPIWIDVGSVPTVDLIRVAMHVLHEVLVRLAEQTRSWRIAARA